MHSKEGAQQIILEFDLNKSTSLFSGVGVASFSILCGNWFVFLLEMGLTKFRIFESLNHLLPQMKFGNIP